MFIAMNRFKVRPEAVEEFTEIWRSRDSQLSRVPGFVEFQFLKGPEREDHVLFASHTVWRSFDDFANWTKSEHFRAAHKNAGDNKPLYLGPPEFEGFEVVDDVK
ncbi:antibiotic biosynthesis monooxygenase family protein [Afifella pfennigii]|uniref:antibiotic biosynthesis monooxygenase family protein n=1 Tax=Afifella pfennigii TaxID=209897 RepID=UPI00047D885D|nr:antibiotic biosynthesis monooxygenase [Afifella pfennigii]